LIFKESGAMEGAYGLAIILNMLMTTTLLVFYFGTAKHSRVRTLFIGILFFTLETLSSFQTSTSLNKVVGLRTPSR